MRDQSWPPLKDLLWLAYSRVVNSISTTGYSENKFILLVITVDLLWLAYSRVVNSISTTGYSENKFILWVITVDHPWSLKVFKADTEPDQVLQTYALHLLTGRNCSNDNDIKLRTVSRAEWFSTQNGFARRMALTPGRNDFYPPFWYYRQEL